jgi:hypothetical protein
MEPENRDRIIVDRPIVSVQALDSTILGVEDLRIYAQPLLVTLWLSFG